MARKGENIYKRKDKRWEGRYIKGHDLSGKARFGYVYGKTYLEVKKALIERKADSRDTLLNIKSGEKATLARYCEEWLTISRNRVKPSTYAKYRNIILHYIIPHIGPRYPQELTTLLMEQYVELLLREGSARSDKGLSPKTLHDTLCVLRAVIAYIRRQPDSQMPEIEIVPPRCQKQQIRVLTMAEQERLIRYLRKDTDDCKFGVLLALLTGMRIGEVCALQWRDISLPDRVIYVRATMQRLQVQNAEQKTAICIGAPKSENAARDIPLSPLAVQLCAGFMRPEPEAYILTGQPSYMEPRALQYRFARYTQQCGLEHVNFHALRHTFATRCIEVGFEVKSLSEILGHSNVKVTLDRYVHSSMELKRTNINKLSAIGLG